jgi:RNA polymerase sigma factor (sigma-70 family)
MDRGTMNYEPDLELARRVSQRSLAAWHEFVTRYSALIRSIIKRYHPVKQEDDQRNLYVEILEYMFHEGLSRYDGRAALSTWVMTVTRSRCLDLIRRETGRRRPPRWLELLPDLERRIYQLYYIEYRSAPAIMAYLGSHGYILTQKGLDERIQSLESHMDRSLQKKLAYDLQARSVGALSGRLLELLDHLRLEHEGSVDAQRPDVELFEKQTTLLLEEIRECVKRLGDPQTTVIELRFYHDMSAPSIARRLNLSGPRRVHNIIQQGLSTLRDMLEERLGHGVQSAGEVALDGSVRRT